MKVAFLAATAAMMISSTAFAAVVAGSETCGELPNAKWSWGISYSDPVISGGDTSTAVGDVTYNTTGKVGTAVVTTTTEPTLSTQTAICTAYNPQGKVNLDHSTSVETVTVLDEGGTSSSSETVCNPGRDLPNCPL